MRGRLRYMHFRAHPPSALDRWCLIACISAAAFATLSVALASLLQALPPLCMLAPTILLGVPWLVIWLGTRPGLQPMWQHLELPVSVRTMSRFAAIGIGFTMIVQAGLLDAGERGPAMLVVMLFLAQSFGLLTHRQDGSAVLVLIAASATCLLVATVLGSIVGMVLFLICLWITGTGILWVHARTSRRRLNLRFRLAPSREDSVTGLWSRALLMAMLVPILAVATNLGSRGVGAVSGWSWSLATSVFPDLKPMDHSGERTGGGASAGNASDGNRSGDRGNAGGVPTDPRSFPSAPVGFADELQFDRGLGTASRQDRLVISDPFAPGGRRRFHPSNPLFLTCTTYDRFTASGLSRSNDEPEFGYDDIGDGRADEWTQVGRMLPDLKRIELDIQFQPLLAPGGSKTGRLLLPRLEPLIAVSLPQVRYSASGMLTAIPTEPGVMHYGIRSQLQDVSARDIGNDQLDLSHPTQMLMPNHPSWQRVNELVRQEVRSMDLSDGPVRGVLRHFRKNYRYELDVRGSGPSAMEAFFRDRQGYCTYFATAAALCLRELGIPARIAAGYSVTRWDMERQVYLAGAEGAHAWAEVPVKGMGWVPVDATPASGSGRAADWPAAALERLYPGEDVTENMPAQGEGDVAMAPDGDSPTEDELGENESDSLIGLVVGTGLMVAWQFWAVILTSVLMVAVLLMRFSRWNNLFNASESGGSSGSGGRRDPFKVLIQLLVKRGYCKHRSQTTLEFSHRVMEHGGEDYDPMHDLTWMRYQQNFGGYKEHPQYREEVEEFIHQVRNMD